MPLRVRRDVVLVRDHDDGDALVRKLGEEVHYLDGALRVEVSGRLVREYDGRIVHERPGDRDALLLSARELRGRVRLAPLEPDALEQLHGARLALAAGEAAHVEVRKLHVLERARPRQEVEVLEDEAELHAADLRKLRARTRRDLDSVEEVRALRRHVEAAEDVEHRRLAGAGRAHDRDELPLVHAKRNAVQRVDRFAAYGVDLVHVANLDEVAHWEYYTKSAADAPREHQSNPAPSDSISSSSCRV